jgi:hypothetical protein
MMELRVKRAVTRVSSKNTADYDFALRSISSEQWNKKMLEPLIKHSVALSIEQHISSEVSKESDINYPLTRSNSTKLKELEEEKP